MDVAAAIAGLPRPLTDYPPVAGGSLLHNLLERVELEPFNAVATAIFALAIVHTFMVGRFTALSHDVQRRHDEAARAAGRPQRPSVVAEALHFLGEVEVVFGLWVLVLAVAMASYAGWDATTHHMNSTVNYTEALFVVVIMALASTRPIVVLAEAALRRVANTGGGTPAAWWITILTIGPVLGSFVTEPAAMTICALLLARHFYDLQPGRSLRYATLGLLFVNISIGGTLTHFAAPPVLMVAGPWKWDTAHMFMHFGWKAAVGIIVATVLYFLVFRRELAALEAARRTSAGTVKRPDPSVPLWLTIVQLAFLAFAVFVAHYPPLFVGAFLFFLAFAQATAHHQGQVDIRSPLLVGFFLAGLVIHGGLQAWWIEPVLKSLGELPLFIGATILTAFNDNAAITYLATLVPGFTDALKYAVVAGAVTGGGLTVIANAPNPAGQNILQRFFPSGVSPGGLLLGALPPTLVMAFAFLWL